MNPYLQIAREHLTVKDLEMLLAEKREGPAELTDREKKINYWQEKYFK